MAAPTRSTNDRARRALGPAARAALAALGFAALVGPQAAGGCAAPFDSPGRVNTLRIVSVELDKPYASLGDQVTFDMTYFDGRELEGDTFAPVQITWLGGCFNPPGGTYYGCYAPLADLLAQVASGQIPPTGLVAQGPGLDAFSLTIPDDVVSSLDDPPFGPKVGVGYVFFMACAGEVRPIELAPGETEAGDFPLGCFDASGNKLGAEAFVPGYTQVYVFEDGRTNDNPEVRGLEWDGELLEEGGVVSVPKCSVSAEDRRKSGCGAVDEFTECTSVELDVDVPNDVAEPDPDAKDAEGNPLREVVWVSYLANAGDFESETLLVSDASSGIQKERTTRWVPPEEPGLYTIWAVVRDNRGGSTTVEQLVQVE